MGNWLLALLATIVSVTLFIVITLVLLANELQAVVLFLPETLLLLGGMTYGFKKLFDSRKSKS